MDMVFVNSLYVVGVTLGLSLFARVAILSYGRRVPRLSQDSESPDAVLSPAEIAYLVHGDARHAAGVLLVDLAQRDQRVPLQEGTLDACEVEYKRAIDRTFALVEVDQRRSDLKRLHFFDAIIGSFVRDFAKTYLADPMKLKTRIVMLCNPNTRKLLLLSNGISESVLQAQLATRLRDLGLVAQESVRNRAAIAMSLLTLTPILGTSLAIFGVIPEIAGHREVLTFYLVWVAICAPPVLILFCLHKAVRSLNKWQPLAWAATEVPRRQLRAQFLRMLIACSPLVMPALALLFLGVAICLTGFLWGSSGGLVGLTIVTACTLAAMFGWALTFQLLCDTQRLFFKPLPTKRAVAKLEVLRERIGRRSPLSIIGASLASETYDPSLSQLVAMYGPDVAWLLQED